MHECASPASPIVCWFWCSHFSLAARTTNGTASSEELDLHSFTTTIGHLSETFPGPFPLPSGLRCALYICLKAAMIVMFAISRLCDDRAHTSYCRASGATICGSFIFCRTSWAKIFAGHSTRLRWERCRDVGQGAG